MRGIPKRERERPEVKSGMRFSGKLMNIHRGGRVVGALKWSSRGSYDERTHTADTRRQRCSQGYGTGANAANRTFF